jgi:hypothetical protein
MPFTYELRALYLIDVVCDFVDEKSELFCIINFFKPCGDLY